MSITDFVSWIENSLEKQIDSPASAEVIRTGLQPQVDIESSKKEKEDHDDIMALDSHVQRLKEVARRMQFKKESGKKIQSLIQQFVTQWDHAITDSSVDDTEGEGLGSENPSKHQLNYMKDNQPLPEPRSGDVIPGGKPSIM